MPRWAIGRLPELAIALTTLGRVQGNVTVLARQMECEEASVRAWLLRLRELGDTTPDVPPPDPEIRLRIEADRRLADLDEALAQRNKLDEELREHKAKAAAEIVKLRKELDNAQQKLDEQEALQAHVARLRSELDEALVQHNKLDEELRGHKAEATAEIAEWYKKLDIAQQKSEEKETLRTKVVDELATLKADEANVRRIVEKLQTQHNDDEAEFSRLRRELASAKEEAKSMAEKLTAAEQERAELSAGKTRAETEVAVLREAAKKSARTLAKQAPPTESMPRKQANDTEAPGPKVSKGMSEAAKGAYARMDEQLLVITRNVCLAFITQAKEQGYDESIHNWINLHNSIIHKAAQYMARVLLTERMAQEGPIPVAEAAQDCYQKTIAWHCSDVQSDPLGFYKWLQESKHRGFLIGLATAIILGLDARSSTGTVSSVVIQLSHIPVPLLPAKPKRSAMADFAASLRRNESRQILPSQVESQMPRTNRIDPLGSLMKDKVQLEHLLAEYQEERLEEVTGQLLEPFNETTVAAAARQAAQAARREYYFRPHGLSRAALELSWVIENELLDPYSEKALFGEVMDQVDELKEAVEKIKPKRKPY